MQWEDAPWDMFQSINVNFKPPELKISQEGWKEDAHVDIVKKKEDIFQFEQANEWEMRKKITNPYEAIFSSSDSCIFPSIANVVPLSRSYFKMVEILNLINFWDTVSPTEPFISAHVCEGPGGFLQNIVEEAKLRNIPLKNAHAITLKSTRSQIPGWKKSTKFLKKHEEIHLDYGVDMTGDILNPKNQDSFCRNAKGSMIFTADGGFDFSLDYTRQEESSFPLLLASFIMGLRCLKEGGTMVIKIFDMYSEVTRDLILGTAAQFSKFMIYKPATSRPCNSERYFIAEGYQPTINTFNWCKHLEYAQTKYKDGPLTRLVSQDWPDDLEDAMQEQIEWQENMQILSIDQAILMTKHDIPEKVRNAIEISKKWCVRFNVPLVM